MLQTQPELGMGCGPTRDGGAAAEPFGLPHDKSNTAKHRPEEQGVEEDRDKQAVEDDSLLAQGRPHLPAIENAHVAPVKPALVALTGALFEHSGALFPLTLALSPGACH